MLSRQTRQIFVVQMYWLLPLLLVRLSLGQEQCNYEITAASGEISSPNYPRNYPNNMYCTWSIQAPAGLSIRLEILDFHLIQPSNESVCSDYLLVLNGTVNDTQNILFKSCGDGIWQNTIVSTSHVMTVVFYSNYFENAQGFLAEFEHITYREEFLLMADEHYGLIFVNTLAVYNTFHVNPTNYHVSERSIQQIDFDRIERMIYFTDTRNQLIGRINLEGVREEEVLINGLQDLGGIAVNYVSRLLIWSDDDGVFVSDLNCQYIFKLGDTTLRTRDLAVDQLSSYVFWVTGQNTPQISRVEGDGSNLISNFVEGEMLDPIGLTLDVTVLYWCDKLLSIIEKINTDGSGREVIAAQPGTIRSPIDLTIDTRGTLYWSEDNQGGLDYLSANGIKYGEYILLGKERDILGIISYSSEYVFDQFWSVCGTDDHGGCEQLCLPNSYRITCQDVLPVVVGCPAAIVRTTYYYDGQFVSWGKPEAYSPISSRLSIEPVSSHNPGDKFNIGDTMVYYTFTDDYGNTANCNFSIYVMKEDYETTESTTIEETSKGISSFWKNVIYCILFLIFVGCFYAYCKEKFVKWLKN